MKNRKKHFIKKNSSSSIFVSNVLIDAVSPLSQWSFIPYKVIQFGG